MSAQSQSWLEESMIYEVFVGRWQCANVIDHPGVVFDRMEKLSFHPLRSLGFNTIYLLGVFDNRGPILVKEEGGEDISEHSNRTPSIFAVSDHRQTNPQLGTIDQLGALINNLHRQNFKVIIDFIPNHTGSTHEWVNAHPEYYALGEYGFVKEFSGDVYKLNYANPSLRTEMIETMNTIASWGADGIRCDMAHLVPTDFWLEAISHTKQNFPEFACIAEAYGNNLFDYSIIEELIRGGFDAVYHGALYENLKKVFAENQPYEFLNDHLEFIHNHEILSRHLVHYFSNHDDSVPGNDASKVTEMYNIISKMTGAKLIYNGSLKGHLKRLAHHYVDILPDNQNEVMDSRDEIGIEVRSEEEVIALDIGGSKIEAAMVDSNRQLHSITKQPTVKTNLEDFLRQVISLIQDLLAKHQNAKCIAIALPGIINDSGVIQFSGGTLHILSQVNLKEVLQKHFNLPVFIENDAKCFALGEALWGAGSGYRTVVGIIWGTGIGSGIIIDQKLFKGAGAAGEIGHIPISTTKQSVVCGCGKANCLESYASGGAIQNQYHELGGEISGATVKDIVMSNEIIAESLIEQAVIFMAEGIVAVINMLDPDIIVIGGGVSHIEDKVFKRLEELVATYRIKAAHQTIITKRLLQNGALVGVAKLAKDHVKN